VLYITEASYCSDEVVNVLSGSIQVRLTGGGGMMILGMVELRFRCGAYRDCAGYVEVLRFGLGVICKCSWL